MTTIAERTLTLQKYIEETGAKIRLVNDSHVFVAYPLEGLKGYGPSQPLRIMGRCQGCELSAIVETKNGRVRVILGKSLDDIKKLM